MKALLASVLTALVLVTAAWASNVTPAQLSALSKRVTALEKQVAALKTSQATTRRQVDACLGTLAPVTIYDVTIHHSDGTPDTVFPTWSPPDPGDAPAFWVPESATAKCAP